MRGIAVTRPLDIPQRQAVALLKAAKKAGGHIEYDPVTKVYRLIPGVSPKKEEPVDEDDSWRL